ncbi:MAG: hypothetical protein ACK46G_04565 [Flavobacteriales bacterium]
MASRKRSPARKGRQDAHDVELQRSLDRYGMKLIKVVGVVGVALGLVILIAFWYWVMGKLISV